MRHVPSFARAAERDQSAAAVAVVRLAESEDSLDFLRAIYRDPLQPMPQRMRAAIEALPFERPRLGAIAYGSLNGRDFASLLDRAIARSGKGNEVKQIEGKAIGLGQLLSSSGAANGFDGAG